jgi:predicted MPP superfamily phosphohydrolase
MKKILVVLILVIFVLPASSNAISREQDDRRAPQFMSPGDIIAVSCSDPYPTLGQPVYLLIEMTGAAEERIDVPITVTDEFSGFVMVDGELSWISGESVVHHLNVTIGKLPRYTKRIAWYPSVVGNHTLHVTAAAFPEQLLTIGVSFDVEGIICPSLGCPSLLIKNNADQLQVAISEKRNHLDEPTHILTAELQDVSIGTKYTLENQTVIGSTWSKSGETLIEDDTIISYDINSIPAGFYNISVTTTKRTYDWPHAVHIRDMEPTEVTIVQLSDVHVGKYFDFEQKKQELIRMFTYVDETVQPDFIILSGDSVDWYNQRAARNSYLYLQEALLSCMTPVFTTPGNHERYANRLLLLYYPFTNLTGYHRFLNPLNDYSLIFGDVNFVFLDSGYEYSRWEIQPRIWNLAPEGSGLTLTQMYLLENLWGRDQPNQIITMHHPAVNDKNDSGLCALPNDLPSGNDECIAFNRGMFISYCIAHNVSLVLTGHTHKNHVFTSLGKETENPSAWPLFVQTTSGTMNGQDNGGRVIHLTNSTVVSYEFLLFR